MKLCISPRGCRASVFISDLRPLLINIRANRNVLGCKLGLKTYTAPLASFFHRLPSTFEALTECKVANFHQTAILNFVKTHISSKITSGSRMSATFDVHVHRDIMIARFSVYAGFVLVEKWQRTNQPTNTFNELVIATAPGRDNNRLHLSIL